MNQNNIIKKQYSKPSIELVSFSLAGSIAASCVFTGTNTDGNTCSYNDNGWTVFGNGDICKNEDGSPGIIVDDNGKFCYHAPTDDTSVFSS